MTKEEWAQVEDAVKSMYHTVELKIDGYKVSLRLERLNTYKNIIRIYVDGKFEGKWLLEECEQRRRFMRRREKSLMSNKQKAAFKKLSKKRQKEFQEYYDRKYVYYEPWWMAFGPLKRHLIAENESIEIIKII